MSAETRDIGLILSTCGGCKLIGRFGGVRWGVGGGFVFEVTTCTFPRESNLLVSCRNNSPQGVFVLEHHQPLKLRPLLRPPPPDVAVALPTIIMHRQDPATTAATAGS